MPSGRDGAVVQFHERAGEVETDARTDVAVVRVGRGLVEALEDGFQLVLWDAYAAVFEADVGMVFSMGEREQDVACRRGELEGVRKDVDNHLVEVVSVYPYGQFFAVVLVFEVDVLGQSLLSEEFVFLVDERHHVGLAHAHHHLSLVYLS